MNNGQWTKGENFFLNFKLHLRTFQVDQLDETDTNKLQNTQIWTKPTCKDKQIKLIFL